MLHKHWLPDRFSKSHQLESAVKPQAVFQMLVNDNFIKETEHSLPCHAFFCGSTFLASPVVVMIGHFWMRWKEQPFCGREVNQGWRLSVGTVQSRGAKARRCVCLCLPITAALNLQQHHCNCLNCQVSQRSDNRAADCSRKPLWLSAAGIQTLPEMDWWGVLFSFL